jgi:ComF family protein
LLDLLYPGLCHRCGAGGTGEWSLCAGCSESLPSLREPFCRQCGEEFEGRIEGPFQCPNCRGEKFAFEFARPALPNHPDLLEMIHAMKYHRRIELCRELGRLALRAFDEDQRLAEALAGNWPLIPVPLYRGRELWRYFNQAEEIARGLAGWTGLPLCKALARIRGTGSQTRLSRSQRLNNLRGAFELTRRGKVFAAARPAGAVLVDDVFTTGATTDACARVLRRAGVQKVVVVTVMRG